MTEPVVVTVIQVRAGSTRLPGKALKLLAGRPLIAHVIDRVRQLKFLSNIILAFPDTREDRIFFALAENEKVGAFAGSEADVLGRLYGAVAEHPPEHVIRCCGDNPVIAMELVPAALQQHLTDQADYTAMRGLPLGTGCEIVRFSALKIAVNEAVLPHQREHVTPFIWENTERFRICRPAPPRPYPNYRLTVDTEADWQLQELIFNKLYQPGGVFTLEEVVKLLEQHPEWLELNRAIRQKPPTSVG